MIKVKKNDEIVCQTQSETIGLAAFAEELNKLYDDIEDPSYGDEGNKQVLRFEDHEADGFISITLETGTLESKT